MACLEFCVLAICWKFNGWSGLRIKNGVKQNFEKNKKPKSLHPSDSEFQKAPFLVSE